MTTKTTREIMKRINSKTKLSYIEKKYGVNFGRKKSMLLVNYLRETGYPNLANLITNK